MRLLPQLLLLACLATPLAGQGKPAAATADPYVGTFSGNGGAITTGKQGASYTGTITANGVEYPFTARKVGRALIGTFLAQGQGYLFSAAVQGDQLTFVANGQTTVLQRGSGSAASRSREETGGGGRSQAQAAPRATGQDAQIERILLSSPWCYMHYSQITGSTNTERGVFLRDGRLLVGTGHEMVSSGQNGTVYGSGNGSTEYRWRVQSSDLWISENGAPFAQAGLRITQNSNGYPILNVNGKEYSQCN